MALDGYSDQSLPRQAIRRAMQAEMLDARTEAMLTRAWREHRDEAALHRLIKAYMRLAVSMAAKFRRYGAPMADLVQEASLGLMRAADRFDPDRGVRFSTYAVWWIRAAIQDYVMRNWSLVRTGSTGNQKALFFNLRRVQARLEREAQARGEAPDPACLRRMVAEEVGVPLADVEMMEGRLSGSDFSLDARQAGDDEGRAWIDLLEDDAPQPADAFAAAHDAHRLRGWLAAAMAALTPRERRIVAERRLREAPRTLESLGAELGISKERVRQIEAGAYQKLRHTLETRAPEVHHFL